MRTSPSRTEPRRRPGRLRRAVLCLIAAISAAGDLYGEPAADPFAACEERFRARPGDYESSYCFYAAARRVRQWHNAAARLERLRLGQPENHWPRLALAHVQGRLDPVQAEATYRAAAATARHQASAMGEVLARSNLYKLLVRQDDPERAGAEVDRVIEIGAAAEDPIVIARSLILEADHLRHRGHDLETAYRRLRQAEPLVFPGGPYRVRRACLTGLGSACYRLGRYREARRYYQRLEELAREAGDDYSRALYKYNQANTFLAETFELPAAGSRDRLLVMYRDALAAARDPGYRSLEIQSHRVLGDLLSRSEDSRARAADHYRSCVDLAREMRGDRRLAACLRALGGHHARWGDRQAAADLLDQSLELARQAGDHDGVVRVLDRRMRAAWITGARPRALAETRSALDALEAMRDRQSAASGRSGLFAAWSDVYYWPAGRLLEGHGARETGPSAPPRADLELAFNLTERLRARTLLEAVASSRARVAGSDDSSLAPSPRRGADGTILADLVRVQRRLLNPGLTEVERRLTLRELERLEMQEAEARQRSRSAGAASSEAPGFAELAEVEAALAENEALLSFQVALWQDVYGDFGGGSWLLASTHRGTSHLSPSGGTRVYRLPDRVVLRPAIRLFRGLFDARDGSETGAAAALGADLLAEALADLPPAVDRLVIVPDGDLHLLPFAALRTSAGAEPLSQRFQLSRAPSATLWLRWRRGAAEGRPVGDESDGSVLALADPLPPGVDETPAGGQPLHHRDWALADGSRLGALPHARREGRAAVRHLGAGSRLLAGAEATEHHLKSTPLAAYRVLHFAAHAVIDSQRPQRSAVVLAPGTAGEDGLLQPRDVAGLDLEGRVVVLSACQSASGAVLRGEGVLSLARAFFEAGASTVVGSLWRLRDDEAAVLFDRFYRHLAKGESVAGALAAAQDDRIRAGAPAAAWAGVTVLGDGAVVPVPGGRPPALLRALGPVLAATLLAATLLALAAALRRRRHRARPRAEVGLPPPAGSGPG